MFIALVIIKNGVSIKLCSASIVLIIKTVIMETQSMGKTVRPWRHDL